jgi:hypothetical protein
VYCPFWGKPGQASSGGWWMMKTENLLQNNTTTPFSNLAHLSLVVLSLSRHSDDSFIELLYIFKLILTYFSFSSKIMMHRQHL